MKTKTKQLLFILICITILSFISYFWYTNKIKNEAYKNIQLTFITPNDSYEIGTKLDAIQFIKDTNAVEIKYPIIDSHAVGEYTYIYIAYDVYGNEREFILVLVFVDSIKPVLTLTQNEASMTEGENVNFESYINEAYDPVDGKLEVTISIPKDYLTVGIHEIKYSITDKHNNTVSAILSLTVNEKIKEDKNIIKDEDTPKNDLNNDFDDSNKTQTQTTKDKPPDKYYMFDAGYNMVTASDACRSAMLSSNYSGTRACVNLKGDNGLYIGVKLEFY